jgi:hypothetical protein
MSLQAPAQTSVVCLNDQEWRSMVDGTPAADVYYQPAYVRSYEKAGHGSAVALLISIAESRFLLPLLLRPLADLAFAEGTPGFDAISAYGYGGLLLLSGEADVSRETIRDLFAALKNWCAEANVISVLLRLHPLFDQEKWFAEELDAVTFHPYGPTIAYDLQQSWNQETGAMRETNRGRRSALSYARRHLTATWASSHSENGSYIEIFQEIYNGRMGQLQAADFYYFPAEYYRALIGGLGKDADIVVVWREGVPVGTTMVMAGRMAAHAHLTGSTDVGREYNASTLLMIECTKWARRHGCRWLLVGGGPDHLFHFKRSFGGELFPYSFVTFIADAQRYTELTAMRDSAAGLPEPRPNFFPEYRA